MCAAYDALAPQMKVRIENLRAYHSVSYSQAKAGLATKEGADYGGYGSTVKEPPLRPLVKVHPETGRRALMVGRHAFGIPGLAPDESERLLDELADFACQPPRVYHHNVVTGRRGGMGQPLR